jgi:hypothetical protein
LRNVFFSEEKKQKTFVTLGTRQPGHVREGTKVFWFFFSKKNSLSFLDRDQRDWVLERSGTKSARWSISI